MKRPALLILALLVCAAALADTKPLAPGTYAVKSCPPAIACPPATVCPEAAPCPSCPSSPVTATSAAPPVCLQSLQPLAGGADLHLGMGDPVASAKAARPWYKDWRFWAVQAGVIGVTILLEDDDDPSGGSHHHHETIVIEPSDPPGPDFCWPPGHCKGD